MFLVSVAMVRCGPKVKIVVFDVAESRHNATMLKSQKA